MTKTAKTATPADVIALATAAVDIDPAALRAFARLARANGYHGRSGGWIYSDRRPHAAICQGWWNLANYVRRGAVRLTPETVLDRDAAVYAEQEKTRAYDARVAELAAQDRPAPQAALDAAQRAAARGDLDQALAFLRDDILDDYTAMERATDPEPADHTAWVDDGGDTWVRTDDTPGWGGSWWPLTDGPGWDPRARDGLGTARKWSEVAVEYGPLIAADADRTARAVARVLRHATAETERAAREVALNGIKNTAAR